MAIQIAAESSIPYLRLISSPDIDFDFVPSAAFTRDRIQEADALIVRSITRCDQNLLAGARVRLICSATAGYDHIDVAYCGQNRITWRNSPGCNSIAVAQYVMGCLAHLSLQYGESITGASIGIVGVGNVGKQVERFARALGLNVLLCDPPRAKREGQGAFVSMEDLLRSSDIITLHVPLIYDGESPTYHLIDDRALFLMDCKPILINASRGAIAKTSTLIAGKSSGALRRIVIDCWENEPMIDKRLLAIADIATPHIAGFSADGKAHGSRMCMEAIRDFYGVEIRGISNIKPEAPDQPVIDLSSYNDLRILKAIAHTFTPTPIERSLRADPQDFERLRKAYTYPREMSAYTVVGATVSESNILRELDFDLA